MEKSPHYHRMLPSHSFSIHSLADGSEVISETEEIKAIKIFRDKALKEISLKNYSAAIQFLNDALEIDDKNPDLLKIRAQALLNSNNVNDALTDIERLSSIIPESPEVKALEGILLEKSGKFEEAVQSHLNCLEMASVAEQLEIRDRLIELFKNIIDLPEEMIQKLSDLDPSICLVDLGLLAQQNKRIDLSIKLLTKAQPLIGSQRGLRMRSLLALAHSYISSGAADKAMVACQDCLNTANEASDLRYQVKALVSLASLYHAEKNYCQAAIHYERLLDLKSACETTIVSRETTILSIPGLRTTADGLSEINGEDPAQTVWPLSLDVALHANLSLAYKNIGDLKRAREHALEHISLLESMSSEESSDPEATADAHWLAGELAESLGDLQAASIHFKANIAATKTVGDSMARARGYGRLGSVYAGLRHAKLAETYHMQHVLTVEQASDADSQLTGAAWRAMGESMILLERFEEADECFVEFLKNAMKGRTVSERVLALSKMGEAYRAAGRHQHALFYFQEAEMYADEEVNGQTELNIDKTLVDIQMAIAFIHSHSNFVMELQAAQNYLDKIIPSLESQIQTHREQNTHCPETLIHRLDSCLRCLQKVQMKSGNRQEAIATADKVRKWSWYRHMTYQATGASSAFTTPNPLSRSLLSLVSGSQLMRIEESHANFDSSKALETVRRQEAMVLYYSILDDTLVIWVLSPEQKKPSQTGPEKSGNKKLKFKRTRQKATEQIPQQTYECAPRVLAAITEWWSRLPIDQLRSFCDNRALPLRYEPLQRIQRENELRQNHTSSIPLSTTPTTNSTSREHLSPEQQLYELLIEPIKDVLNKFAAAYASKSVGSAPALIIIPDQCLAKCPFHALSNREGRTIGEEWRLTVVPSLFILSRVLVNELDQLELIQSVERQREEVKHGGALMTSLPSLTSDDTSTPSQIDSKRITDPYLIYGDRSEVKLNENVKRNGYSTLVPNMNQKGKENIKLPPLKKQIAYAPSPRIQQSLSSVTGTTCTGTDICRSSLTVPEYRQIIDLDRCLIIGNPSLPKSVSLNRRSWYPPSLLYARDELREIGSYCAVDPVDGDEATKDNFLELAPNASLLHIVTWACCLEGSMVFTPNSWRQNRSQVEESAYLVRPAELLKLKLNANLVILSGGWSIHRREVVATENLLPSLFLLAGAQSVLMQLWAVPREVQHKFYYSFYKHLQNGATVTEAHNVAVMAIKEDKSYIDSVYWGAFVLFGKDVYIDLNFTRHAQLDQQLDAIMKQCNGPGPSPDPLNPPTQHCKDRKMEKIELREELQRHIRQLLRNHLEMPGSVEELSLLLDSSVRAVTPMDYPYLLHEKLTMSTAEPCRDLLRFLGFQVQPRGPYDSDVEPFIILPAMSAIGQSAAEAVRACVELKSRGSLTEAVINYLPAHQESLSFMIDLLCITKHAGDLQLKVSDLSVKYLWQDPASHSVLDSLGYIQVGPMLHFSRTTLNNQILRCCLQLLLSFSTSKSPSLLNRLDVNLLGTQPDATPTPQMTGPAPVLRSLEPRVDQSGRIIVERPWLTTVETNAEMNAKIQLSKKIDLIKKRSMRETERNKSWLASNLQTQAVTAGVSYHHAQELGPKVKRQQNGVLEGEIPLLTIEDTSKLRTEAHKVAAARIRGVRKKYADETKRNFYSYCK